MASAAPAAVLQQPRVRATQSKVVASQTSFVKAQAYSDGDSYIQVPSATGLSGWGTAVPFAGVFALIAGLVWMMIGKQTIVPRLHATEV